jgi:hypothetical protein
MRSMEGAACRAQTPSVRPPVCHLPVPGRSYSTAEL